MLQGFSGFANMWEMDENNHLNVQFFVDWFHQALDVEAVALGHGPSVARAQGLQLRGVEDTIVFDREIRGADMVCIESMVTEIGDDYLMLFHIMKNETRNEISSSCVQRVHLVGLDDFTPSPLTDAIKDAAQKYFAEPDPAIMPRPMERLCDKIEPDGLIAEKIGLHPVSVSAVSPQAVDWTGRMRARFAMARGSDGAARMWSRVGISLDSLLKQNMGTVVLQVSMTHHNAPKAGTVLKNYGGLTQVGNKTLQFAQWYTDAETGEVYTSSDTVAVQFSHDERKSVGISGAQRAALNKNVLKF